MRIPPGRVREPRRLLWTGLLTLGIGFAWYYFRAFQELDFNAGRRHNPLIFFAPVPIFGPFLAALYMRIEQKGLDRDRAALGLLPGLSFGRHTGWVLLGILTGLVIGIPVALATLPLLGEFSFWLSTAIVSTAGLAFAAPRLAPDINEVWQRRGVA